MDSITLCKPSVAILLVAVAGTLYHLLAGELHTMIWWLLVGILGTGVFQSLCYGGLEPVAWVLMAIPVLIVCFFLAVALFASRMRIENVRKVPCGQPRQDRHDSCKPRCNKPRPCECDSCRHLEEDSEY
jgi:hypothetical protein